MSLLEEEAMAEEVVTAEATYPEDVLTLHADNFDDAIAKHPFILVEFYAPCETSPVVWTLQVYKSLAREYEKVAHLLSKHDPTIVLAKVNANDEMNKLLAGKYEVHGFPTLKILRNRGKNIQEYKGLREAKGIIEYSKKQVGVFMEFSGTGFTNFLEVAEKLRSDYDFGHIMHANHLPRGDAAVERPLVRLFKTFNELVVDSKKLIDASSTLKVVTFDKNPDNHPYLLKFFQSNAPKPETFLMTKTGLRIYISIFTSGPFRSSPLYIGEEERRQPWPLLQGEGVGRTTEESTFPCRKVDYFGRTPPSLPFKTKYETKTLPRSSQQQSIVIEAVAIYDNIRKSQIRAWARWCPQATEHCQVAATRL
ncbi:hypothetical protein ZWY2020_029224, partial [Hordeum vulgare]